MEGSRRSRKNSIIKFKENKQRKKHEKISFFILPKEQDQLKNAFVYDIETLNQGRAIPYQITFYLMSSIQLMWDSDLSLPETKRYL